jgi:hypothetical protein
MIREGRFLISRTPYAVDLSSLRGTLDSTSLTPVYKGEINAVWYQKRKGRTMACIGTLWDFQDSRPGDAEEFLSRLTTERLGGRCHGRWNGTGYWADLDHTGKRDTHLAILRPMLDSYPAAPDPYDAWWRF